MNSMRVRGRDEASVVQVADDAVTLAEIGGVMCAALDRGIAVVSIATGTHRRMLENLLTVQGIDVVAALNRGQYVSLNALETLAKIIIDGAVDTIRFAEVVGALIDRTAASYRNVLIFGELVPLMHADGKRGAPELENLWQSFVTSRPIFSHCECPSNAVDSYRSHSFARRAINTRVPPAWAVVDAESTGAPKSNPSDSKRLALRR